MPFSGSDIGNEIDNTSNDNGYLSLYTIIGGFEWYVDLAPDEELWSRWTAAGCVSGLMHEQGMDSYK